MNGKLILKIVESALAGRSDELKMLVNVLSHEVNRTNPDLSRELSKLVISNGSLRSKAQRVNPNLLEPKTSGLIENSLVNINPFPHLESAPVLPDSIKDTFEQVIVEHHNKAKLQKNGLEPVKTLLFEGPPGVGKTMSAQWLAQKLDVPLLVLDLATVMNSQLGKTGNNLKSVIEHASSQPCVLLLDEFDAIAKKRDDEGDVGELKRLVTVLLQSIDAWPSSSILVAATNHAELLDPAVWRRFEEKFVFSLPNDKQVSDYLESLTGNKHVAALSLLFRGMSYSDIKTLILKYKKISLIRDIPLIEQLIAAHVSNVYLEKLSINEKKQLAVALIGVKLSQRKVSELLNISRQTIKKAIDNVESN